LQQGEVTRVGSEQTVYVDVRNVAVTHSDLIQLVETNKFKEDLLYCFASVEAPRLEIDLKLFPLYK
jgi:DNA-binding NtrC family response regulator